MERHGQIHRQREGRSHKLPFISKNKEMRIKKEVMGRINCLVSFDTTWTEQKTKKLRDTHIDR
jgi:hypothetical protein